MTNEGRAALGPSGFSVRAPSPRQWQAGSRWQTCAHRSYSGASTVMALRARSLPTTYSRRCSLVFNTLPLLFFDEPISKLVTNDAKVRHALEPLLWVLAVHVQTRITNLATGNLLIPVGKPWLNVLTTFFAFYVLGAPVSALGAATNLLVTDLKGKMLFCVGCTSIAQAFLTV